jgi:pimeloyl-ACP methyl ester carboxylesterase
MNKIIQEEEFRYIESGKGQPLIILHGLMGGLSNFKGVMDYFPAKGYQIIIPELPVYSLPILNTSVKSLSEFLYKFIKFRELKEVILLGNSLGGHIGLLFTKNHPELVKGLVLTGSSGLYENNMGDGYPKRGDYSLHQRKRVKLCFTILK